MKTTRERIYYNWTSTDQQYKLINECGCKSKGMFKDFRESGLLCDVTLKIQGVEVHAHKIVLAAKSSYFRTMFTAGFAETQQAVIELDKIGKVNPAEDPSHLGLKAQEFMTCIDFIYTGNLEINKPAEMETLVEIAKVANFLELSDLLECVIDFLVNPNINYLNYENMKMVTELFLPYDSDNIIQKTVRSEIVVNSEEYVEEFPDDWEFVLTVWPDFLLPFKISNSESLNSLTYALRNINENVLNLQKAFGGNDSYSHRYILPIEFSKEMHLLKCTNPEFYFECLTKLEPNMEWICHLNNDIIRDEEEVLMMIDILEKILKEKDENGNRASFMFPLRLLNDFDCNFGNQLDNSDVTCNIDCNLGKLLNNADVTLKFSLPHRKPDEVFIMVNTVTFQNRLYFNFMLKRIHSMLMKRAQTKSPPLHFLTLICVDLTDLMYNSLAEIATETEYASLTNCNFSRDFLQMLVHHIKKKSSSQNIPLRRISFLKGSICEFRKRGMSQYLTIACNISEVDFSRSKLSSSDLKEFAVALKAKAIDKTLALQLLSLKDVESIFLLQDHVFADLVCSAKIVDLRMNQIRPSQLRNLADRVSLASPETRLKYLCLMRFILVHDNETSVFSKEVFTYVYQRPRMSEVHSSLAQLLALLNVFSFSTSKPSCNFISPNMFDHMKKVIMDLSENKEKGKQKVGLLKTKPRVNYFHHDDQNRSEDKDETCILYQRRQCHYWNIYTEVPFDETMGEMEEDDSDDECPAYPLSTNTGTVCYFKTDSFKGFE